MAQGARIISFNGKRANDIADTTFTQVDTFGMKQMFRRCSMSELRVIQELLSDAVSSRKRYFPTVGERIAFMHGRKLTVGQVVRIGKKTATVYSSSLKKQLRVPYPDIKTTRIDAE